MLLPAVTGSGESVLVTERSARVCTVVVAVPVLLPGVGSVVVVAAVAELLIVAPLAVLALTFTTIVKTAVSPAATVAFEKTIGPEVLTLQPVPVVTTADTSEVFAGTASVTVTICASDGPLFEKLIVYVRLLPALTGSGESVLVTVRSACVCTVVVAVAVLLALLVSVVVVAAVTELLIVAPLAVDEGTCTTIVNTAVSPAVTADFEKTMGPEVLVLHPEPVVTIADTKVVPG